MKRLLMCLAALCVLLCGCTSWFDRSYVSITPHQEQGHQQVQEITSVSNYMELREALTQMVENGTENNVFSVRDFDPKFIDTNMALAIRDAMESNPVGAYAVENISYEVGTIGGETAAAVVIEYNNNHADILRIRQVEQMDSAKELITAALEQYEAEMVLRVKNYADVDYIQLIRDHADQHPAAVMEVPQVSVSVYPESGNDRIIQLQFTYQTSRESLLSMQSYVQPVFSSAALYVSGEGEVSTKYAQLYSLLMERNDYTVQTSITPAYSLLRHGVGDSKAFAVVYAAMCRRAQLDCMVISGTRAGEPWYWNIICDNGNYYHVDLLQAHSSGGFRKMTDGEMSGYVWDYSAYPPCGVEQNTQTDGTD